MMRKLRSYVHVGGRVFGPRDEVPEQVADQITNPKAWADAPDGARNTARVHARAEEQQQEEGGEPKRPAKNASVDTWRSYLLQVADYTDDEVKQMTKEQVIDTVEALDDEE